MQKKYPNLYIVMRTYFEKPRTTVGWEWLISDPDLNWSFNMNLWLEKARKFLYDINKLGLATATEFLEPITCQYIADLVSWWAIWARTTESQTHRHMASWLSMPIWFKNATSWDTGIALDAIISSKNPHKFIWINNDWCIRNISSKWNKDSHIILRWWKGITNYDEKSIEETIDWLEKNWINTWIIIDTSHANSEKKHEKQVDVAKSIASQIPDNTKIVWVMIESNINSWNQSFNPLTDDKNNLKHWVSITDWCVDLKQTEEILKELNEACKKRNKN
jgi:3-deoxy-7-phosphoheptulonate synthase